jgi:hypothetical protein
MVDEDATHCASGHAQVVRFALPTYLLPLAQAKIGLVHKGGCLKCVAGALPPHEMLRECVKLVVNERKECIIGGLVAFDAPMREIRAVFALFFRHAEALTEYRFDNSIPVPGPFQYSETGVQ